MISSISDAAVRMVIERNVSPDATGGGYELQAQFGKTVREARQKAGLTQAALADLAGLTQQYVAIIEAGQINPTLVTIAAIARILHLDGGDMLRQAGSPTE